MGAPPVSAVGTALHATVMSVLFRVAATLVTSAGATATPKHPEQTAEPLSSALVRVTSKVAGDVRLTLTGTVSVVPSVEIVGLPLVVTPESFGNATAAPEWKLVPVNVRGPVNAVPTYCGDVLVIAGPASIARSLLAAPKSGLVTVTVTVDGASAATVTGMAMLLPVTAGLSVAVMPVPKVTATLSAKLLPLMVSVVAAPWARV